jgi:hypothetical protein
MITDISELSSLLPHELIRVALQELDETEQDEKYRINMVFWHLYDPEENICEVCFAGAVLRGLIPFYSDFEACLPFSKYGFALNNFRLGAVRLGLESLGFEGFNISKLDRIVVPYKRNKRLFKEQMADVADKLEELYSANLISKKKP